MGGVGEREAVGDTKSFLVFKSGRRFGASNLLCSFKGPGFYCGTKFGRLCVYEESVADKEREGGAK